MTNGNNENRGISQLKGNSLRERQNAKPSQTQQGNEDLPAEGDEFRITLPPDEPSLEDDEQLKQWLHNAHNNTEKMREATDKMRERIGKVLKEKRDLLASQGKASDSGWQEWVENNCDFTLRTANRYIKSFTTAKELPDQDTQGKEKPIRANVTFSDNELGKSYKALKNYDEAKDEINREVESAVRKVTEKYQNQAQQQGLELDEYIHNLKNQKEVTQTQD